MQGDDQRAGTSVYADRRPHVGDCTKFDAAFGIFGDEFVGEQSTFFLAIAMTHENAQGFFGRIDPVTASHESCEATA